MRIIKTVRKNYIVPKNIASFGGLSKQRNNYASLSPRLIRRGLQGVSSYSLHRERKEPRKRNPFFILKRRQQVQIDLLDISSLAQFNDGIRYLFCGIDMFSKKAFVSGMVNKSAISSEKALKKMLLLFDTKPDEILSDRGTEFKNSLFLNYLRDMGIKHRFTNSEIKCAGVERFNKTIQGKIYRYLTQNNTSRYIDVLPDLVTSYNNTPHRTIGVTPNQAETSKFEEYVRGKLFSFYNRGSRYQQKKKFEIGDHVRISIAKSNFQRSYGQKQKFEVFEIDSFNQHMPIPMYHIRSLYDGQVIEGGFYEAELVKVDCLRIRVVRKKKNEVLVQWLDDPLETRSWINRNKMAKAC